MTAIMHVMIAGQTETHTQIKPLTKVSFHHLILCRPVQLRSRASKHVVHRAMPIATPTALQTDTRSLEKGYQALFAGFVSVNVSSISLLPPVSLIKQPNASVGLFLQTPEWDMVQPTLKILRARHKAHEADVEQMAIAVLQRPTNVCPQYASS